LHRFHENTLEALKELVPAAALERLNQIRATHVMRRGDDRVVRLLADALTFVQPGELLAAMQGQARWPHAVCELYWPRAQALGFAASS